MLTGARYLVAITRLDNDTAAELAYQWKMSEGGPLPIPGHPGFYFVAEVEGEGRPLTHHLGRRHPIAEAAGLVAQLLGIALSAGDKAPLLHPELIRVRSALGRPEITPVATRCARLLSLTSSEFAEPLWSPSCLSPEGIKGAAPTPASLVFSSATLLWWLVHGVPPFGILPLEELQRLVNPNLQSLPPLLAHVGHDGPEVDAALREHLFGPPASRLTPETWVHILTELEIGEPETTQHIQKLAPQSLRAEFRLLVDKAIIEGSPDFLELLLEKTPFSVYELELALEVLGLDKGKGRLQGSSIHRAERCINEALIRARARTRLMVVRDARERAYSQFVMEIILWKIISCEKSIFENHPDRDRY